MKIDYNIKWSIVVGIRASGKKLASFLVNIHFYGGEIEVISQGGNTVRRLCDSEIFLGYKNLF